MRQQPYFLKIKTKLVYKEPQEIVVNKNSKN